MPDSDELPDRNKPPLSDIVQPEQSKPMPISDETISRPAIKGRKNQGAATLETEHGKSTVKVYPVTETSMNLLKVNSANSSRQYSLAAAFVSAAISMVIDYAFSGNPTPFMEALVVIGPIICLAAALVLYYSGQASIEAANDEWQRIQKNTSFQSITSK
jgi:hypothetical protein